MKKSDKIKVFFFANIPIKGVESSYGGATTLAEEILRFLFKEKRIEVKHRPIRYIWKPKWHLLDHIAWIFKFPFVTREYDVISIHATWDFTFTTAPIIWLWARLMGKRIVYHHFGGDFHKRFDRQSGFIKYILKKTILNSDVVFFETKMIIKYFKEKGIVEAEWLPNARKSIKKELEEKDYNRRFVFISRVIPDKGVNEIIEAAENLPENYIIDLYGPIDSRYFSENEFENKNVHYKGALSPKDVNNILDSYDILLLPTWFFGEGYPGIIIEALSLGIPSISTYWNAIPEIIENDYNGKLIPIKNSGDLEKAILSFDESNYQYYRTNAFKSFENFDSDLVFEKFVNAYLNDRISK